MLAVRPMTAFSECPLKCRLHFYLYLCFYTIVHVFNVLCRYPCRCHPQNVNQSRQSSCSNCPHQVKRPRVDLSVMIATILLFESLITLLTSSVISHASEPYVRIEHTLDMYSRIRSRRCSTFAVQIFRIFANLVTAMFILLLTSVMCHVSDCRHVFYPDILRLS